MEKDSGVSGVFDFKSDWFFTALLNGLAEKKPLEEYTEEEVKEITVKVLQEATSDIAKDILGTLKDGMASKLIERRGEKEEFEEHIRNVWGKPLDQFEIFLELCLEAGILFYEKMDSHITSGNKYTYQALLRLHARGCQVGAEVLTLLNSGFADGAHARWRTLYEITVVAYFIREHGNGVAERYIRYDTIESYRAMNAYRKCCPRLGYEPLAEEEIAEVTTAVKDLCEHFGAKFKQRNGWASEALHKDDPTFADIEKATNFDHMRAHYKLASHNVHAEPKGIVFKLGAPTRTRGEICMLPGPSDTGFIDPADCTALSLYQLTSALLTIGISSNPIWGVVIKVLDVLRQEIVLAFLEVDTLSNKDIRENRRS